jgi:hypothetical protein
MASGTHTLYRPIVSKIPTPSMPYLYGRIFFDYNGSGQQEQREPDI